MKKRILITAETKPRVSSTGFTIKDSSSESEEKEKDKPADKPKDKLEKPSVTFFYYFRLCYFLLTMKTKRY